MAGEQMANRLQILIAENQIDKIHIYRFSDSKLHQESDEWRFGHEFIDVGNQPYNIARPRLRAVKKYDSRMYVTRIE